MNLHKLTKIAVIITSLLSLIILFGLISSSDDAANNKWIAPLINISYIVFAICVLIVFVFVMKNLITNTENIKKTLISVGLFLGILVISYLLANSDEIKSNGVVYPGSTTKLIGAGLNAFYILTLLAIASILWTVFTKIKK